MVPARSNLSLHHDSSSKPYYPQYCVAAHAQLEVATPAAAPARRDRPRLSRVPPRWVAMADDDDAEARRRRRRQGDETAAAAGTSCSRSRSRGGGGDDDEVDGGKDWLQLGLATASSSSTSSTSPGDSDSTAPAPVPVPALAAPMEMDSFAGKHSSTRMMQPPLFPLPIRSYHYQYGHDRYGPTTMASGSMPAAPFLPFPRPLRSFPGDLMMRVIGPPPRTSTDQAAGLWLTLEAARNQAGGPILPQIPKSYLRIKDNNMKVELVMKYLAEKLGLPQSHQVELTCRGQLLPPFLLVKYVRDAIWCSPAPAREGQEEDLPPPPPRRSPAAAAAATTDHVMTLFYSTSRNHQPACN